MAGPWEKYSQSADAMAQSMAGTPAADVTRAIGQEAQDFASGKNALDYQTMVAAAKGDPEARQRVAEASNQVAMGSIQGVGGKGPKGKALPMDEASRMARAKKMGFDTGETLYHGTATSDPSMFSEFKGTQYETGNPIFLTDNPNIASGYAASGEMNAGLNGSVLPVHQSMKNPLIVDLKGNGLQGGMGDGSVADGYLKKAIKDGHDGVVFKNAKDAPDSKYVKGGVEFDHDPAQASTIYAVLDPSQIRSKFAAFDPKKKGSGNLSAALGAATVGAAAAAASSGEARADDSIAMQGPDGVTRMIPIKLKGEAIAAGGKVAE